MKRILLLATTTGYQTRAFGEAAEALGIELVFATDRCEQIDDPWQDGAIPIRFHEEDRSVASIVESARARPIDGIVTVGDRPTVIAARAADALGIAWHPPHAAANARHKLRTREHLRDSGMLVPWFLPTAVTANPRAIASTVPYPCIVKPVALSGSRGVMRADDPESFVAAFERLAALLRSPEVQVERNAAHESVLVEAFIPGREYAIEALLDHGTLQVLAIFDKPDPLDGPFFEETIYVTPSRAPEGVQRAMVEAIERAAGALGLRHGPIHAECRANDRGVFVLEVAARPIGGICARALRFEVAADARHRSPRTHFGLPVPDPQSRITFENLLLRHACGEDPGGRRRESDASGVMMIPIPRRGVFRGVEGEDAARQVANITDIRITAKVDQMLVPLPEGASYLGFIFARASTPSAVEHALRDAHARLRFRVDTELTVLRGSQIHYNQAHG